jgi:hypothetical protein
VCPAGVRTTSESSVPGSRAGHKKLTCSAELNNTGTACPLIFTVTPANSRALPEGSEKVPMVASHLPRTLLMALGKGAQFAAGMGAYLVLGTRSNPGNLSQKRVIWRSKSDHFSLQGDTDRLLTTARQMVTFLNCISLLCTAALNLSFKIGHLRTSADINPGSKALERHPQKRFPHESCV